MHLVIAFDGHDPRELPVTDLHTITVEDGVTGRVEDVVALDGVRALFLVRSDGTEPAGISSVSVEEGAAALGWISPDEAHALQVANDEKLERIKQLESTVEQLEKPAKQGKTKPADPS